MSLAELIEHIERELARLFPDSTADTPVSFATEREPDGSYIYAGYIEVRTPREEFDTRGQSGASPQVALARAFHRLRIQVGAGR